MNRAFYSESIEGFCRQEDLTILGALTRASPFEDTPTQKDAWLRQIAILRPVIARYSGRGKVYFEFSIPRLGRRIDVVLIVDQVVFVIEFKIGEREFPAHAVDQVWDYALDLKNFHEPSHGCPVAPVLIASQAPDRPIAVKTTARDDHLIEPICGNSDTLPQIIEAVLAFFKERPAVSPDEWEAGRYCPTPTIIEAARALYSGHGVAELRRNDAAAMNLGATSDAIDAIIERSRARDRKSICFVTGVPGAGKTLVGLNIATKHFDKDNDLYSVFLSGNGPLVAVLREALARDQVRREKEQGRRARKGEAMSEVKMFIQNVHNFLDDCLPDLSKPPVEHVALFDEAQRAWNLAQTSSFMLRKKKQPNFNQSEPEFLVSCLDRHPDWAVVVCLVGGGQEINTGEAGISEWIDSLLRRFPEWDIYISPRLTDTEYGAGEVLKRIASRPNVEYKDELHLAVSMRSFRAEHVSLLVKQILDLDESDASATLRRVRDKYPIMLTRDLQKAKRWLRSQARGTERYGLVASSQAQRLKPHAIDVRSPMDPVHWFLDDKSDVRSSYYLEDVATEFHVQGLELDWACVIWDGDFRYRSSGWEHWSFCGDRWNRVRKPERQVYMKNAYRVLLTRARQGMVIMVPEGSADDPTRTAAHYDETYSYLRGIGMQLL